MSRFRVRYQPDTALVRDFDEQFVRGGLLVRVDAPEGLAQYDAIVLEVGVSSERFELKAQVVQIIPGQGVVLAFDEQELPAAFVAAVESARAAAVDGAPAEHDFASESDLDEPVRAAPAGSMAARKIHLALHGSKQERMKIMRDGDRTLHGYVLRNPRLRLDEVAFIAKMTAVSPDLLKAIAERRDWVQRPEVAMAIVRNPKSPVSLAIQMLQYVAPAELRRLAKSSSARMPILQAARKKVVGS